MNITNPRPVPGEWRQDASIVYDRMMADPIAADWSRRSESLGEDEEEVYRAPEDVLGSRTICARVLLRQALVASGPSLEWQKGAVEPEPFNRWLAQTTLHIWGAEPYLWLEDVRNSAASQEIPPHTFTVESVPSDMWWVFEKGLRLINVGDGVIALGLALMRGPDYVDLATVFVTPGGDTIATSYSLPDGFRYPDDCRSDLEREWLSGVLGMLSFLHSPYIPKIPRRIAGRLRRTFERERAEQDQVAATVQFVDLRSPEQDERSPDGADHTGTHHHRWIVRGHHRAQWYPSLKAHKVIWIAPHVKGPEGAPLKTAAYRVVR